jgi:lipoprotein signal peptidase
MKGISSLVVRLLTTQGVLRSMCFLILNLAKCCICVARYCLLCNNIVGNKHSAINFYTRRFVCEATDVWQYTCLQ